MITSAFLMLFSAIIALYATILPDTITLPANASGAISYLIAQAHRMDSLFPVSVLMAAFFVVLQLEGAILAFKIGMWVFGKLQFHKNY